MMLKRLIAAAFAVSTLGLAFDAFASCGEVGRPPCNDDPMLERVDVIGMVYNFQSFEWPEVPNFDDWDHSDDPGDFNGPIIGRIPDSAPIPTDYFNGRCVTRYETAATIPGLETAGGGYVVIRICMSGRDAVLSMCLDFPDSGWTGGSGCP